MEPTTAFSILAALVGIGTVVLKLISYSREDAGKAVEQAGQNWDRLNAFVDVQAAELGSLREQLRECVTRRRELEDELDRSESARADLEEAIVVLRRRQERLERALRERGVTLDDE